MTLKYEFVVRERPIYRNDWDVDYETETTDFEYDPDYSDLLDFYHQLDKATFIDAGKHAFRSLSDSDKAFFLDPKNGYAIPEYMKNNKFDWAAIYDDIDHNDDFISEIMMYDQSYMSDELHGYFESDAKEAFDNQD